MKLKTKLILSFSVVVLLVGGIGITSSYINESVKDQVTTESRQAIEEVKLAGEMGLQLYQSLTKTQYLLEEQYRHNLSSDFNQRELTNKMVVEDINSSIKNFRQSMQNTRAIINKDHSLLFRDTTDTAQVLTLLNRLEKNFNIYTSLVEQLQQLSIESYDDGKEFFTVTIEPYFRTNLLPLIEEVRNEIQKNHEQKIAGLNSKLAQVGYILGIATVFALMVAISLTFFLYRSIANPIKKLADAAQSIAQGNLDKRINYQLDDELGQLSQTFNNMAESLSRTTVSRDYVDSIIESMADLLVVTDQQYNISRINSAGLMMLDCKEKELLNRSVTTIFKDGENSVLFNDDSKSEKTMIQGAELLVDNDKELPVNVSKGTIKDREGTIDGYVIVASNISSEREAQKKIKQSLKEKEVLLAEIHHRVKNNLAVISGLLQMQIWEAENEKVASALQQSQLRVRSIALVHEKLYQSESLSYIEFDKYIEDLLQAIRNIYRDEESNIKINTNLQNVILNINQAIPCSLLINELVINSFKYGFDDGEKGTIEVSIEKNDSKVKLTVKDNGKGFHKIHPDFDSPEISLIDTLAKQLNGDLTIRNENGATTAVLFENEEVIDI